MPEETKAAPGGGEPRSEKSGREKEPVKVPEKFKGLVESIEKLSVMDLAELVKILEEKFGVSAQAPVAAPVPASAEAMAGKEEKSTFTVELKSAGDKKIDAIKVVKEVTGKGLKEAKDFVEAAASSPQLLKDNVKKEEAEEIKKKFEAVGAQVELK